MVPVLLSFPEIAELNGGTQRREGEKRNKTPQFHPFRPEHSDNRTTFSQSYIEGNTSFPIDNNLQNLSVRRRQVINLGVCMNGCSRTLAIGFKYVLASGLVLSSVVVAQAEPAMRQPAITQDSYEVPNPTDTRPEVTQQPSYQDPAIATTEVVAPLAVDNEVQYQAPSIVAQEPEVVIAPEPETDPVDSDVDEPQEVDVDGAACVVSERYAITSATLNGQLPSSTTLGAVPQVTQMVVFCDASSSECPKKVLIPEKDADAHKVVFTCIAGQTKSKCRTTARDKCYAELKDHATIECPKTPPKAEDKKCKFGSSDGSGTCTLSNSTEVTVAETPNPEDKPTTYTTTCRYSCDYKCQKGTL